MEKFYLEKPSIARKDDAIEYINENYKYKSDINGSGGLDRFLDNYEGWLEKLEKDYTMIPSEERVPARTYFLVRESDNRIVGMINIRTALNQKLSEYNSIKYIIDLHRDSLSKDKTTVLINDKNYAKIKFVVGLDNFFFNSL